MDPLLNPYASGAGTPPPELSGRQDLLERWRVARGRTRLGGPAKGFIAAGLRGVAKTVLLREAQAMASSEGYRVWFDRLTPRGKSCPRAMAALGPGVWRTAEIADRLNVKTTSVAPMRSGPIAKGVIYSPQHGETAFTVPMFDDFPRHIMPDWAPQPASR